MTEKAHESRRDELAAYLLGALEPGEAAELERHLAGCEECRADLEWLRPAAQTLPEAVERVEPPRELRARVMAEIEAGAERDGARHGHRGAPAGGYGRRLLVWLRGPSLRPVAGLAAVLAIIAGVAGYAIHGRDSGGGATTVVAGRAPGVTAEVVREGDSGTLRLANVGELPPGRVLQAWVRRGKRVESAKALFVPNRDGTATAAIGDMRGVNTVMVTAEPRGGSAHPTSPPIIAVAVPQ
jgi:anti-sigma-K factor RskA